MDRLGGRPADLYQQRRLQPHDWGRTIPPRPQDRPGTQAPGDPVCPPARGRLYSHQQRFRKYAHAGAQPEAWLPTTAREIPVAQRCAIEGFDVSTYESLNASISIQ